ncbi:YggS family pyridoxal phosphate-dependent enzyme [bacterium AH-315-J21]|nr:YggS family pyridoxal phosphate-dependent enzyme [bacterium AH-315-J21]
MRTEQLISIADNLKLVNEQIQRAAQKAGRQASEITLLAVSKFASVEKIVAAYQCGQRFFGESRIQESQAKIESLRDRLPEAKWSLIGHLQSNKAGKAIDLFDQVQSVDSLKIAEKLSEQASKANRTLEVLLEINSSGEKQKYGVSFSEAPELAEQISNLKSISLAGLMTIGPHTENEATIRKAFAETKALFDSLDSFFVRSSIVQSEAAEATLQKTVGQLSMGMSADFELAIAEGSTEIRIGTSIFGPRESKLRT